MPRKTTKATPKDESEAAPPTPVVAPPKATKAVPAVPGVTRLKEWPKSVRPEDQD